MRVTKKEEIKKVKRLNYDIHILIFLILILLAALIAIYFLPNTILPGPPSATEWPMFRGSPEHLGYTSSSSPTNISNAAINIFIAGNAVKSSPAVSNGYVYVESNDNNLYQLNASNISQKIASYIIGSGSYDIYSSPIISNGYVYAAGSNGLYQLNVSNINQKKSSYNAFFLSSSPVIANDYLYIGDDNGYVYQLNSSDVSKKVAQFLAGGAIYSSPAVSNGYVYVGSWDKKIYQLNASNISQKIAEFMTNNLIYSSPAVSNGYVYVVSVYDGLYQLNASNISQMIKKLSIDGMSLSSPAVSNGYVYAGLSSSLGPNYLYQLNASDITKIIHLSILGDITDYSSPAVTDSYVFIGSRDSYLYQFNASDVSKLIAKYKTGNWVASSPAVANGSVYVGSADGKLYQFSTTQNQISSCQVLNSPNTYYVQTANIVPSGNIFYCIQISAQNITFDCQGYWISNSSQIAAGIYSDQNFTTIKNCNVSMSYTNNGFGITLQGARNSYLFNNTLNNNNIGIRLQGTRFNNLSNNVENSNYEGIHFDNANNNFVISNTANNNINGFDFGQSNNNIITNSIISNSNTADSYVDLTSINNTFLNVTYNQSREYVEQGGSQLIRQWYYRAYVTNNSGIPLSGVNITAYDSSGGYNFNLTTDATGYTPVGIITDYEKYAARYNYNNFFYYSNYTIYANKQTLSASHSFNSSLGNNYQDSFILQPSTNGISSCQVLSQANTYYNQTSNIIPSGNIASCISITAPNVTFDCKGYWISNPNLNMTAVYTNQPYTTIKNCNISMNFIHIPNSIVSTYTYGIYLNGASNSYISNNTLKNNGVGIYLDSNSINNTLTSNTMNTNFYGIYLDNTALQNTLTSNTAINNAYGISIISSNNILISNIASSNDYPNVAGFDFGAGISISSSNNNTLISNIANDNYLEGIVLSNTYNNILTSNTLNNNHWYGLYLTSTNNNILTSNTLNNNNLSAIYGTGTNNTFLNCLISNSICNDTVLSSGTNIFLNCTYNKNKEIISSNSQLVRGWYYQAYVSDSLGNVIPNVNVTAFNKTGNYNFNLTTDSTGYTKLGTIIDYVNTGGVISYYSNFTIYALNANYLISSHGFNSSLGNNYKDLFTLQIFTPPNPPKYSNNITSPSSPTEYSPNQQYQFNITWIDDSSVDTALINFNGINYIMTKNGNVYSKTFSDLSASSYNYYFLANDTSGNTNQTSTSTYVITKANAQTSLVFDKPSGQNYGINIIPTCSIVKGVGPLMLQVDTSNVQSGQQIVLSAGSHNFNCSISVSANYSSASNITGFVIAQSIPSLSLAGTSPQNYGTIVGITGTEVNSGDADLIYNLYRNNILVQNPDNSVLRAGTYNYAYNTTGGQNYSSKQAIFNLIVNKASSTTNVILNPASGITYEAASNFSCSRSDADLIIDGITRNNEKGLSIIRGARTYQINCSFSGNENYTGSSQLTSYTINKNTNYNLGLDASPGWATNPGIETRVTASNCPSQLTCVLKRDSTVISGTEDVQNFGVGNYVYNYSTSGNENYSSNSIAKNLRITNLPDTQSPLVIVYSPIEKTYLVQNITINFTAIDDYGIDRIWWNNGTSNLVYSNPFNVTLADGTYNLIFYANDTSGNVNSTSVQFSVDIPLSCTDSDNGINFTLNGTLVSGSQSFSDYCKNSVELNEYFCNFSSKKIESINHICDSACEDGYCLYCGDGICSSVLSSPQESFFDRIINFFKSLFGIPLASPPYVEDYTSCPQDCPAPGQRCGDGFKNSTEECDLQDFGNKICQDFGYTGGSLSCNSGCDINFSGCLQAAGENVLHLKFNENSGSVARDSSGFGNDGNIIGATWTNGLQGNALSFNGASDWINISNSTSLSFDKSQGTIMLWIKYPGNYGNDPIDLFEDSNDKMELALSRNYTPAGFIGGQLFFYPFEYASDFDNYVMTRDSLPRNTWTHIAVTWNYSQKNAIIYVNGTRAELSVNGLQTKWNNIAQTGDWIISRKASDSRYFNGTMDELKVWNRILSDDEIMSEYNCGNGKIDSGEECDSTNLSGKTCESFGFSQGSLSCSSNCKSFVISDCSNPGGDGDGSGSGGGGDGDGNGACHDTCTSKNLSCGMQTICGLQVNCGDCLDGKICNNGTCLFNSTQIIPGCSESCKTKGYSCGIWTICGVQTICGNCNNGDRCDNGICGSLETPKSDLVFWIIIFGVLFPVIGIIIVIIYKLIQRAMKKRDEVNLSLKTNK